MVARKPISISFIYKGTNVSIIGVFIFLSSFYILYILQPNGVKYEEQKIAYWFTCFVQSLIPILTLLTILGLIPKRFKHEDRWNILSEFILVLGVILLTGICNFLVRDIIYDLSLIHI